MSDYPLIIIGAGLSGLAAGIRFARFDQKVLILEKHSKPGGLNSYYQRKGYLFETGLHAITNYARPDDRRAPLNRLLRQLKLSRRQFQTHEQLKSEVLFRHPGNIRLQFSNDFELLRSQVAENFPRAIDRFNRLVLELDRFDPFTPRPRTSARKILLDVLTDELLVDMLMCPLMFYGSSEEMDMDYSQFVIMFRSIFQEGLFRPAGTMKDFLEMLVAHYRSFGGEIRYNARVDRIVTAQEKGQRVNSVRLASGEQISCDRLLSTIGWPETIGLRESAAQQDRLAGRLSFVESIHLLPLEMRERLTGGRTIIFFNLSAQRFQYRRPAAAVDFDSGVICFPDNFQGLPLKDVMQLRVTHIANYDVWRRAYYADNENGAGAAYRKMKSDWLARSKRTVGEIVGNYHENIVYEDSFTPVTIERFTGRTQGAVYGSPLKIKDGRTSCENLFLAGTDQGFLGIVGSMLSGISMVNQHLLN